MTQVSTTRPDVPREAELERRKQARLRAAACRTRLRLASDALAAVDLLLGVNHSIASVGREHSK